MSETTTKTAETTETKTEATTEKTFTQSDVDALVGKARIEERRKASEKYADYDDLKKKAGESATAEEKITKLEQEVEATKREALKRRVQAAHQISDEDADLFLTGTDEQTLTSQAKRLAERESDRKKTGNRVSREGTTTTSSKADPMREFTRNLFDRDD